MKFTNVIAFADSSICRTYRNEFTTPQNIVQIAKPGDVLEFDRGVYYHAGVYLDNGEVLHKQKPTGGSQSQKCIRIEKVEKIGRRVRIGNRDGKNLKPKSRDEICAIKAKYENKPAPYNLILKNCEHYAYKIRTGKWFSYQVSVWYYIRKLPFTLAFPCLIFTSTHLSQTNCLLTD